MTASYLRADVFVLKSDLRASIARVDPGGFEQRRNSAIPRTYYSEQQANRLWHMDA
jgi:hypothetical protein